MRKLLSKNLESKLALLKNKTEQNSILKKINLKKEFSYNATILQKKNPFILFRKNYHEFYKQFLKKSRITKNMFKFLNILHWPKIIDKYWRNYYQFHPLELKKLKVIQKQKKNNLTYFINLIYKRNYFSKLLEFNNQKTKYRKILKTLYILAYNNKKNYHRIKNPKFINEKRPFKELYFLKFKQRILLQKIVDYFFPITSLKIKEKTIHSLPMKTKKPRRV